MGSFSRRVAAPGICGSALILGILLFAGIVSGPADCTHAGRTNPRRRRNHHAAPAPTPIIPVTDQYQVQTVTACAQPPCAEDKSTLKKVTVTDNYRWLEDNNSPRVRQWIQSQIAYTNLYLSQVKIRPQIVRQLTALMNVDTQTVPLVEKDVYFFKKRMADQNQSSIYMRRGLHGADTLLVDAAKLSADQNTSVTIRDASRKASGSSTVCASAARMKKHSTFSMSIPIRICRMFCPMPDTSASVLPRKIKDCTIRSTIPPEPTFSITLSARLLPPTK